MSSSDQTSKPAGTTTQRTLRTSTYPGLLLRGLQTLLRQGEAIIDKSQSLEGTLAEQDEWIARVDNFMEEIDPGGKLLRDGDSPARRWFMSREDRMTALRELVFAPTSVLRDIIRDRPSLTEPLGSDANTSARLSRAALLHSGLVLVCMPFSPKNEQDYLHQVLSTAVLAHECCGIRLNPKRADGMVGDAILSDIEDAIGRSAFVILDLTGANPNVMYELGWARCAGKPLLIITQDEYTDLPSNVSGCRVLRYGMATGAEVTSLKSEVSKHLCRGIGAVVVDSGLVNAIPDPASFARVNRE